MPTVYQLARAGADHVRRYAGISDHSPVTFTELVTIAKNLGARVQVTRLPLGISGMIIKYAGSPPRIYISHTAPPEQQLFNLAHQIGHLWERAEIAGDDEYSFMCSCP